MAEIEHRVGFTGHRNRRMHPDRLREFLARLLEEDPELEIVHGGAEGADTQVQEMAEELGIPTDVIRPDYKTNPHKGAPLIRDRRIVDTTRKMVALYDGREGGGTAYTISYAIKQGKSVTVLRPTGWAFGDRE